MGRSPVAGRSHVEFTGICLGEGDELRNRVGRNRWVHFHDLGYADDTGDRRDVVNEIEIELAIKRRVDRVPRADQEQRIAIRGRAYYRLGADIAAGTWPVLDDEWLSEPLREPLPHQTGEDIGNASRGKTNDKAHRLRGIGLRACNARDGGESGSARCQ